MSSVWERLISNIALKSIFVKFSKEAHDMTLKSTQIEHLSFELILTRDMIKQSSDIQRR